MILIAIFLMLLFPMNQTVSPGNTATTPTETQLASTRETDDWNLCCKNKNVNIFQRWVEAEPGRNAREIFAETLISATPETLVKIIRNENYGKQWLTMADEYEIVSRTSPNEWYAYSKFSFTPLLKFDLITLNQLTENQEQHSLSIGISGQPDYWPEKENFRRLSHFSGKWEFISESNNRTRVRYYLFSKTKPFLPRWITDPFVFGELTTCVNNVKSIAEKL